MTSHGNPDTARYVDNVPYRQILDAMQDSATRRIVTVAAIATDSSITPPKYLARRGTEFPVILSVLGDERGPHMSRMSGIDRVTAELWETREEAPNGVLRAVDYPNGHRFDIPTDRLGKPDILAIHALPEQDKQAIAGIVGRIALPFQNPASS